MPHKSAEWSDDGLNWRYQANALIEPVSWPNLIMSTDKRRSRQFEECCR